MTMMGVPGGVALGWVFAVGAPLGFVCIGTVGGACGVVRMSQDGSGQGNL